MVAAPAPARIIEKSLVSDRVVIDTVDRKYCDHLPLYRRERHPGDGRRAWRSAGRRWMDG